MFGYFIPAEKQTLDFGGKYPLWEAKSEMSLYSDCRNVKMLFLTNELAKKAEITILSARKSTWPGLQAGASWVERKPYKRKGIARDSHLGL